MKILKPHISEKSVNCAKNGHYTLIIDINDTKKSIAYMIKKYFNLDVVKVQIINKKTLQKKGIKSTTKDRGMKKAIITLKDKQTIPGFEIAEDTKKKNKK